VSIGVFPRRKRGKNPLTDLQQHTLSLTLRLTSIAIFLTTISLRSRLISVPSFPSGRDSHLQLPFISLAEAPIACRTLALRYTNLDEQPERNLSRVSRLFSSMPRLVQ
jgi:hypothetical protein